MTLRPRRVTAVVVALWAFAGCSPQDNGATPADAGRSQPTSSAAVPSDPTETSDARAEAPIAVSIVATGLVAPWEVAFTPDGQTFVTERDSGRLQQVSADGALTTVATFDVDANGEGGLLGLAVSPEFATDGLLYVYMTTRADNRIVRLRLGGSPQPVLTGIPKSRIHNGGRIVFGPDAMLYAGTGDAGEADRAQDRSSLAGKILRIAPDGAVPGDNPFPDSPVWSLGHRNVQGLAFDAAGQLFATEFGPDRDDEVNRIQAGANYGWPEVTGAAQRGEFIDPIAVRQPPEAAWSGVTLPAAPLAMQWTGDLLVAALRGQRLWRIPLDGDSVGTPEPLFIGEFGRLRTAVTAPDGAIWLLTNNRDGRGSPSDTDDRIIRLAPG